MYSLTIFFSLALLWQHEAISLNCLQEHSDANVLKNHFLVSTSLMYGILVHSVYLKGVLNF